MSKRPSFQFYPADWQSNANLKRCTFEEKGVWLEVICLLHDSEEYGILRWTLEEISLAVRCDISSLQSLVKKGVLKGSDDEKEKVSFSATFSQRNAPHVTTVLINAQPAPFWYCSRMVRDEYIRNKRAAYGARALQHPNVPKKSKEKDTLSRTLSVLEKDTFSPSPSSSSSSSKEKQQLYVAKKNEGEFFTGDVQVDSFTGEQFEKSEWDEEALRMLGAGLNL